MSLVVWLPLLGTLDNRGVSSISVTNNGATITSVGKLGKCYTTNGSSQYITGTYTATANMSFCIWAKFNSSFAGHLVDARVGDVGYQPMYVQSSRVQSGGSTGGYPDFSYSLTTGTWYHLCIVYTPNDVSLYVNGSRVGTSTGGKGYDYGAKEFTLCCRHSHNNYFIPADVQDFRIYDHSLSAKEVKEISKGLILHYPMTGGGRCQKNEVRNGAFTDSSGNLTGWNNWGACTIRQVDTVDGVNYAHIKTSGTKWAGLAQNLGTPLDVSSDYTLSFRAFSPTSHSMCFGFHWCNSSGSIISQSWFDRTLTTEPKYYTIQIRSGSTADRFNMMVGWNTDEVAEIYFTDIKIERGDCCYPMDSSYFRFRIHRHGLQQHHRIRYKWKFV